jgi:hypothetical protein
MRHACRSGESRMWFGVELIVCLADRMRRVR